jgi:glutathione-regulated potassium-efflux system ancillary protein KefG
MSVLLIVAHPNLDESRVNKRLLKEAKAISKIKIHDLYACSPNDEIDVRREQKLLSEHDLIVFQHPLYWYSVPFLLKKWQEKVLVNGWAYGAEKNLKGKRFLHAITSGSARKSYQREGAFKNTYEEFMSPIEGMARFMGAETLPYFIVDNAHRISDETLEAAAHSYNQLLMRLVEPGSTIRL